MTRIPSQPRRNLSRLGRKTADFLRDFLLSVPLSLKIMGMAVGLTILFGAVTTYKVNRVLTANMTAFLKEESRSIASELAVQSREYLLINDLYGLTRMLKNTVRNRPDLRYAVILDQSNRVLAHTFGPDFPIDLLEHFGTQHDLHAHTEKIRTNEGAIWETYYPILQGEEGAVRVGVRETGARKQIDFFVQSLILNTLLVALAGIFCSALLTWLITRPVDRLVKAVQAVRGGDYSVELAVSSRDEVGRLTEAFNRMAAQLRAAEEARLDRERIRQDFLERIIATQEGERKRIARELHDQTGQALASFMVSLKILERSDRLDQLKAGITELKTAITREMESIHNLALELRPSVLDDMGLVPALKKYVADFRNRYKIDLTLTLLGFEGKRPPPPVETTIYRIIQEALTNISRHARATRVKLILEWRDSGKAGGHRGPADIRSETAVGCRGPRIRGLIDDNGVGFDPRAVGAGKHLGIYGMQERALLLGGRFSIDSEPGEGTLVMFEIPVEDPC